MATITERRSSAARASTMDTLRVGLRVLLPIFAEGPVIRRPAMTALAERFGWEQGIVDVMSDLRRRYGDGPLLMRVAGRRAALVLARDDVGRVLAESPEPFSAASREKRAALRQFQPDGVLLSTGELRHHRRVFNARVLDMGQAMHRLAGSITGVVEDEVTRMLSTCTPTLDWTRFADMHARLTRRIVLGDHARDDVDVTRELDRLRRRANWFYLRPTARRQRRAFQTRLCEYLASAQPGSLASIVAATAARSGVDPYGQVPHWLFAFDAAAAATFRALAALAVDASAQSLVEDECQPGVAVRPYLAACVLDAVRLWPTTLVILRDTTTNLQWRGAHLKAGSAVIIVSSFFHRDPTAVRAANQLDLHSWIDGTFDADPGIVPFSAGPVRCPGRDLVTFTGATVLATILAEHDVRLVRPTLDPTALPLSLDHFRIRFTVTPNPGGRAGR
ncbi:MAG: cytochrome P450 [Micromonosporaceae bacterium]|nr:cytochrome P450 [Micromonosporaceae bacterium]